MTNEEAIKELEWIYQNGFENDLSIIGTDRILDSIRIAIEALEKQTTISNLMRVKVEHNGAMYDAILDKQKQLLYTNSVTVEFFLAFYQKHGWKIMEVEHEID